MSPPHSSAIGALWGTDESEVARNIAYWTTRAEAGVGWIGSVTGRIRNHFIPGFEPSGVSAETLGYFRLPYYVDRVQRFTGEMHSRGAKVTTQLTMIGGFPHAPSARVSAPIGNQAPHVLNTDEIAEFVREYGYSAARALEGGLDGIELHINHDDLHEWFLSPLTNGRVDRYGGSLENRMRFTVETLEAIRDAVGSSIAVGVRMNMREELPGGYDANGGIEIAQYLESTGLIDFIHGVVGTPWGNPSYVQPHFYEPGQWAGLAGNLKASISLPVVHTGLINSAELAEQILAAGHADVVGMARAFIAEPELLVKSVNGRSSEVRPCVGGNECISRRYVDGLPFGCAVNPHAAKEVDGKWPTATATPRRLLVVGGGPAGMELAALSRERGHEVELWEADEHLGGQLHIATSAPRFESYRRYLTWQKNRLDRLGVTVRMGKTATADAILHGQFDVVGLATGALARRPLVEGANEPDVLEIRDVLNGKAVPGKRVVIVAQDDHMPPLALADFLSSRHHDVTIVYATNGPAQLVGRYILGGIMSRLDAADVRFTFMEEVTSISPDSISTRNVYSGKTSSITGYDSVVLACGGESESTLFNELRTLHPAAHILGDAFAPRRLVFATRQAYALAAAI